MCAAGNPNPNGQKPKFGRDVRAAFVQREEAGAARVCAAASMGCVAVSAASAAVPRIPFSNDRRENIGHPFGASARRQND
jgi:hypothetical protein